MTSHPEATPPGMVDIGGGYVAGAETKLGRRALAGHIPEATPHKGSEDIVEREETTFQEVVHRIKQGTFYEDYDWASGPALRALDQVTALQAKLKEAREGLTEIEARVRDAYMHGLADDLRALLASLSQPEAASVKAVTSESDYTPANMLTNQAAPDEALTAKPVEQSEGVEKRVLRIEWDGSHPTAAVYEENGCEVMRCTIAALKQGQSLAHPTGEPSRQMEGE